MGMYTYVRGWISLSDISLPKEKFEKFIEAAKNLSPRAGQCVTCTKLHAGFNFDNYIFIGGGIKNYDKDWEIYLDTLFENFDIDEYSIEQRYEEDDNWTKLSMECRQR